jgi:hypothetical protein
MHKKADQNLDQETANVVQKKIEPERPEKLDKEHGEEVQAPKKKSKARSAVDK